MNCTGIFVGGEVNPPVANDQCLFQFGEKKHASAGRIERSSEQAVIASSIGSGNCATGKAAEPVCLQPFTAKPGLQVRADVFAKTDHCNVSSLRSMRNVLQ